MFTWQKAGQRSEVRVSIYHSCSKCTIYARLHALAQVDPNLTEQCVKNLVFLGRAMHLNPDLCFAEDTGAGEGSDSDSDAAADTDGDDEMENSDAEKAAQEREGKGDATEISTDLDRVEKDVTDGGTAAAKVLGEKQAADPLRWVFNRMAHMVVHKGEARRRAVFSWFGAMVAVHEPALFRPHLNLMLLPLRRAVLDAESGGVEPKARVSMVAGRNAAGLDGGPGKEQTSAELATEVSDRSDVRRSLIHWGKARGTMIGLRFCYR